MIYETDRLVCVITDAVAHIQFKGADVVEYGEASRLGPELRHIADTFEFRIMLIDCAALNFITSTVLEAFVSVYLRCRRNERDIRIVNTNELVRDLLKRTRLNKLMSLYDTLDDALKINEATPDAPHSTS